jgi:hypothetical protein
MTEKSNSVETIGNTGISSRGADVFVSSAAFETRLSEPCSTEREKKSQKVRPEKTKSGYGTSPVVTRAIFRKASANTSVRATGWMTVQAAPSAVCAYRTLRSRMAKK